jgi:TonB family protein
MKVSRTAHSICRCHWVVAGGVALALLMTPSGGYSASPVDPDRIEQLDEVEVTAARIASHPRVLPALTPEVSTATLLPPDVPRQPFTPIGPLLGGSGGPRLLRDETAQSPGKRTRVRYLEITRPPYPRRAREMGWEGTVVLRLQVHADGTVGEVSVQQSAGHDLLDQAAMNAAKGWSFAPQMDGAFAVPAVVDVPVRFDLTQPESQLVR